MTIYSSLTRNSFHSRFLIDKYGNWQFKWDPSQKALAPCIHWYYLIPFFYVVGSSINKSSLSSNQISNIRYSKSDRPLTNIILLFICVNILSNDRMMIHIYILNIFFRLLCLHGRGAFILSLLYFIHCFCVSIGDRHIPYKNVDLKCQHYTDADWV